MTTVRLPPLTRLRGPGWILALIAVTGCGPEPETPAGGAVSATAPKPLDPSPLNPNTDTPNKIERFEKWRATQPDPSLVTCHGFLTASWFHPDGLVHYFVSELLSYDIAKADAHRFQTCEATELHAETFRKRVRELVAGWPAKPKIDQHFGERHLSLDGEGAESQLQAFLDHRRGDTIRVHRLWLR